MYNETYLQHHGVLGQKWGVRRYQNKDGSLIKKSRKKNNGNITKSDDDNPVLNQDVSRKRDTGKKALKYGAMIATTAILAYGTYKLIDSGEASKVINNAAAIGKKQVDNLKDNRNWTYPTSKPSKTHDGKYATISYGNGVQPAKKKSVMEVAVKSLGDFNDSIREDLSDNRNWTYPTSKPAKTHDGMYKKIRV